MGDKLIALIVGAGLIGFAAYSYKVLQIDSLICFLIGFGGMIALGKASGFSFLEPE